MSERYRIEFAPAAKRQLADLAPDIQRRIRSAIDRLELDPRPPSVVQLASGPRDPIWRVRVGEYRVLYEIRDTELIVVVIRIGHRREIYRRGS
jgi:mRNA interferase RelE/StbE